MPGEAISKTFVALEKTFEQIMEDLKVVDKIKNTMTLRNYE